MACIAMACGAYAEDGVVETQGDDVSVTSVSEVNAETMLGEFRASQLIGAPVVGDAGAYVGRVQDMLVDGSGEATFVLVDAGYLLGNGEKIVAVPIEAADISAGTDGRPVVAATLTKDELEAMGEFDLTQYDYRLYSEVSTNLVGLSDDDKESTGDLN